MKESRRGFLRLGALAGATLAGNAALGRDGAGPNGVIPPHRLQITFAGYEFDHVQALVDGRVTIAGCDAQFQPGKIGDLNTHVFAGPQTLEVTEIGLSPFILAYANEGFRDYSLIPVFPLRLFRHKSIFVHTDRGITAPEDLKGRKVGTPGYSSTSLTWIRGIMQHEYGVQPHDIDWVVSTADSSSKDAGQVSKQENVFPEGISITRGPAGKDESDLLLDGDVDALFHAGEPKAFVAGHPKVRRLFDDPRTIERRYFAKTGIFPIMHAIAMRNDVIDAHPWLPEAVFDAYSRAKQRRYEAMRSEWLLGTLPWFGQEFDETRSVMGENFWPYGIEANEATLDALFQYSYEQGLAKQRLRVDDLFHASTLGLKET